MPFPPDQNTPPSQHFTQNGPKSQVTGLDIHTGGNLDSDSSEDDTENNGVDEVGVVYEPDGDSPSDDKDHNDHDGSQDDGTAYTHGFDHDLYDPLLSVLFFHGWS